jgi:hypothetical protein
MAPPVSQILPEKNHPGGSELAVPGNPRTEMPDTALITRSKLARLLDFFPPKADKRWMFCW